MTTALWLVAVLWRTQIATVDRAALDNDTVGTLPTWLLTEVDDGLRLARGLT